MPRHVMWSLAALLVISFEPLYSQQPREKIDLSKLGPQVGQRVPDFSLTDQFGHLQTLKSVAGPKGTMLVFFRSADW